MLPKIAGLTADSRQVKPGFLFAAFPGVKSDGRDFIAAAVQAGATVVLAPKGTRLPEGTVGVTLIEEDNPRRRFALEAAKFYGQQPQTIVAVTGTNGKTSTAQFVQQLWTLLGLKATSLGTVGLHGGGFNRGSNLTTPNPVTLYSVLKEVVQTGVNYLAMEASSHGLDQERLAGVNIAAGGFTNLTRDHLDYHGTMESYFAAKARLFETGIRNGGAAVLNADVPECEVLWDISRRRGLKVLTYGYAGKDFALKKPTPVPQGQRLELEILGRSVDLVLPLIGDVQAFNALCALGLVIGTGADPVKATDALASLKSVRGRMEKVLSLPSGATVYVDYAHTPDGLENLLKGLRKHVAGRLIVVFGCGGDRDRGKRPMMGKIACDLADVAIVTDDNPRSEKPEAIRAEILAGCTAKAVNGGDRRSAIQQGLNELKTGDVLVLAGKGHEQGQTIGTTVHPFDDAQVVRELAGKTEEVGG